MSPTRKAHLIFKVMTVFSLTGFIYLERMAALTQRSYDEAITNNIDRLR